MSETEAKKAAARFIFTVFPWMVFSPGAKSIQERGGLTEAEVQECIGDDYIPTCLLCPSNPQRIDEA